MMPKVLDDKNRNEVDRTDIAEREIQSSPEPAPLADVSAESPPDAAEAEQECEPQASSPGVDAAARVEADDHAEGAGQPGESGIDSQRPDSSWSKRSTAGQSASDPPDSGPKAEPCVSKLQDMLNEEDPMATMVEFETMESEKPFVFESPGDAAGTDPAPKFKPKSKPRSKPKSTRSKTKTQSGAAPESKRPASGGSRHRGESEAETPEPTESDGSATAKLCFETLDKLNDPEQKLPEEERQTMIQCCLVVLLTEFDLHQDATMTLVDMLHDADSESYAKFTKPLVKRGLFVGTGGLDSTPRYAWNKVAIVRPCLIDDLGLHDTDDIVMLDSGLAAYLQWQQLTAEVKRANWSEFNRDLKRVAQLTQINSAAQSSLKIYLGIMKDLRLNKARKEAEEAGRQRQRPGRSPRPVRTVEKSVVVGEILNEFEAANSSGESSSSSAGEAEVQS